MNDSKGFWTQYLYYFVIACISLITLFFLPMIGSEVGLAWKVPNTVAGWIVWVLSNLCSSALNLMIFHSFIKQAKLNIKDNKKFVKASEILEQKQEQECKSRTLKQDDVPLSPRQWLGREYKKKGITLIVFTLLGTIGLSNAILTFDAVRFLTQLVSLVVSIGFGIVEMKTVEEYWTIEYYNYAQYYKPKESSNDHQP